MKKLILISSLLAAGTFVANAAVTIVLNATEKPTWATDNCSLNDTGEKTFQLSNGDSIVFKPTSGNFWGTASNNDGVTNKTWQNTAALTEMSSSLGLSATLTNGDINGLLYTATGDYGSKSIVSLTMSSLSAGDSIVLYALVTSRQVALTSSEGLVVSGITNAVFSYATNSGSDFSSTASYSANAKDYTLVKISGKLGSNKIVNLSSNAAKNGWGMIAYSAVPEPSAFGLLAGLGALALVGARRRRKTK